MNPVTGAFWDQVIAQSDLAQGHTLCSPQALDTTKSGPKVQARVRQPGVAGLGTHFLGERLLEGAEIKRGLRRVLRHWAYGTCRMQRPGSISWGGAAIHGKGGIGWIAHRLHGGRRTVLRQEERLVKLYVFENAGVSAQVFLGYGTRHFDICCGWKDYLLVHAMVSQILQVVSVNRQLP